MSRRDQLDPDEQTGDLFDHKQVRDYAVFVLGALRRRKLLVASVILGALALAIGALSVLPKTYHVEAKLLAQRNQVLAVRGDGPDAVAPTRAAAETVIKRDNLLDMIRATDLVRHTAEHRAPARRAFDAVMGLFHAPETEDDKLDAMVEMLEKRLHAWTVDGTVSIAIDWPDAHMASLLVDTAQRNFLETRYTQEITALSESIAILKAHAANRTDEIDDAVAKLRAAQVEKQTDKQSEKKGDAAQPVRASAPPRPVFSEPEGPSPTARRLAEEIKTKRRVVDDLEQARRQRLSEATARLAELRSTYTDNHPTVVDMKRTVATLSAGSSQAESLKQELATLQREYDAIPGAPRVLTRGGGSRDEGTTPPQLSPDILRLDRESREDRDPSTVYARAQLRDAMDKYSALRAQVQASQIELETAQAAFKYRYSVVTPAQPPKHPTSPSTPFVIIAALLGGIAAALVIAVIADIRSGLLLERWQIERLLDRPILGEMVLPRLPGHDSE